MLCVKNQTISIDYQITMAAKVTKDIGRLSVIRLFIISLNFLLTTIYLSITVPEILFK